MSDGHEENGAAADGPAAGPNASPDLQDAIRSIGAIGENAWGKDDDEDVPRGADAADASLQDSAEVNPDVP